MISANPNSEVLCDVPPEKPSAAGAHGVEEIYTLLGRDAVLLPLSRGNKGCFVPGWPKTTLRETSSPNYQAALAAGDVAVLLGSGGDRICTIDCDSDEAAEALLAANPVLAGTFRTRGARGCNFWVRVVGEIPKGCPLFSDEKQVGEWRADGNATKIAGTHPDTGERYQWLVRAPLLEIAFQEIIWPAGWTGACIKSDFDRLVDKWGIPFSAGRSTVTLCQPFFAGKFAFENCVLFEADEARFYLYSLERGLWEHVTEAKIKTLVLEELMIFSRAQDEKFRPRLELARTDQNAASIARVLRGQVERRGVFEIPRRRVHVLNGMIEIGETEMCVRPFSPEDFSRNQVPVAFDSKADCPRFIDELLKPALAADDIRLLQKWVGGVLLGGNPAQKMLIQEGLAGTGKSTVAAVVEMLVGSESVTQLRTELLHERFETARYVGKRLLAGRDVPGDFLSRRGASTLKVLTGGDRLDAEIKGSMTAPSLGCFDVIVTANSRLRVRLEEDAGAWHRRLLILSYRRAQPPKPVPDFAAQLFRKEGAGILNWALAGAAALLKDLEECGRFQLTAEQERRIDALLAESDSVRAFLRANVASDDGADVTTDELCEEYSRYCENLDWRPLSRREVERMLPDLMLELFNVSKRNDIRRDGKSRKGYSGVGPKTEAKNDAS